MNRKTSWKETTVLKKSILLTLVLAILITLSASTFSLFNKTESVGTSTFSTKIYDVCRANTSSVPDTIEELDYIENSSPWVFMVFNSSQFVNNDYSDTLIDVTLINPVLKVGLSLDRLQVGLYEQDKTDPSKLNLLSMVPFTGNAAKLFIPKYFSGDVVTSKILSLQFFYDYDGTPITPITPISVDNPFDAGTTRFSVKVWGDNYLQNIKDNNWFSFKINRQNGGNNDGKIKGVLYVKGVGEFPLPNAAIVSPITLTINYCKQTVDVPNAYMEISYDSNTYRYDFTNNPVYIPPDVIAIRNDGLPSNTLKVDSLWFNDVSCSGELPDSAHELFVYRNFQTTDTGFKISIKFANRTDSNADFTIYVGNE